MRNFASFLTGVGIGSLGGLIGLGGAEFRLPILIAYFNFATLDAVILNKISSLVVVFFSLPFRSQSIPWENLYAFWNVIAIILAGSLAGAWVGAHYATKVGKRRLDFLIMVLLVGLALGMIFGHGFAAKSHEALIAPGILQTAIGVACGLVIGFVAAVLGVAGGELIIPTLVLLFGIDIKTAGSLSLCISLPTMLVAFLRYTQSGAIALLLKERKFVLYMAAGSILGAAIGGRMVGFIPEQILVFTLGLILLLSALKAFKHCFKP